MVYSRGVNWGCSSNSLLMIEGNRKASTFARPKKRKGVFIQSQTHVVWLRLRYAVLIRKFRIKRKNNISNTIDTCWSCRET